MLHAAEVPTSTTVASPSSGLWPVRRPFLRSIGRPFARLVAQGSYGFCCNWPVLSSFSLKYCFPTVGTGSRLKQRTSEGPACWRQQWLHAGTCSCRARCWFCGARASLTVSRHSTLSSVWPPASEERKAECGQGGTAIPQRSISGLIWSIVGWKLTPNPLTWQTLHTLNLKSVMPWWLCPAPTPTTAAQRRGVIERYPSFLEPYLGLARVCLKQHAKDQAAKWLELVPPTPPPPMCPSLRCGAVAWTPGKR